MKTLATIIAVAAFTFGTTEKLSNEAADKNISHVELSSPAEFGFGHNYYLDIDKDGVSDFLFATLYTGEEDGIHTKYIVNAIGENEVLSVDNNAALANVENPIEEFGNIHWEHAPVNILEKVDNGKTNTWNGLWSGDRDQYIGIRLVKNGHAYTGWVKVFIDQINEQAQVEEYAINRIAEGAINAGEI